MTPHTIETAAHVAMLDLIKGEGLLFCPDPSHDLPSDSPLRPSLHHSDREAMMGKLLLLGWTGVEGGLRRGVRRWGSWSTVAPSSLCVR